MRDKISYDRALLLHPKVRDEVVNVIDKVELGFPSSMAVRIVQGLRTFAEQSVIYAQGRTTPGKIVTNAKPGQSLHNYGLAFDFAVLKDKNADGKYDEVSWNIGEDFDHDHIADWMEVVSVFKSKGWTWGGDFKSIKDYPHLEKAFGLTWKQLLAKYDKKDFIKSINYLNV